MGVADPLKATSMLQRSVTAVRDAIWSFSGVWGIYPHRDGTLPSCLPARPRRTTCPGSPRPVNVTIRRSRRRPANL